MDQAEACVREALAAGYRHVDSAAAYRNEAPCGRAILKAAESGVVPRAAVFFTSKVRTKGMSYKSARATVEQTIAETGLAYIDLMLLHAPYGGSALRKDAWRGLVEAVEAGQVRSIGVSNYGRHHLEELDRHVAELEAERGGPGRGGVVSVGQWEIHPWLPRRDIVQWSRDRDVVVQAYCPVSNIRCSLLPFSARINPIILLEPVYGPGKMVKQAWFITLSVYRARLLLILGPRRTRHSHTRILVPPLVSYHILTLFFVSGVLA